mmetsp:Transcript_16024/g.29357  ORF Transcript_16024/g.29357 Transcript_16024/m.29357 type:complete len:85 (+) Transcript_16024:49-303(+)
MKSSIGSDSLVTFFNVNFLGLGETGVLFTLLGEDVGVSFSIGKFEEREGLQGIIIIEEVLEFSFFNSDLLRQRSWYSSLALWSF